MNKKYKCNMHKRIRIVIIPLLIVIIILVALNFPKKSNIASIIPEYKEDLSKTNNVVTDMFFTNDGIKINGISTNNNADLRFKICRLGKEECQISEKLALKENNFEGAIKLSELENGAYELFVSGGKSEKLTDTREQIEKINRANLGNKLITFNYSHDRVKLVVEDFKYEYDILIDPGHGGRDGGSDNGKKTEKDLNLEQSLYEKKRYEDHGLKVKMIREDDSYGIKLGDAKWSLIRQRSYAIGYYGTVSKVIYSNHHNWSENKTYSGWEIIVPAQIDNELLTIEKKVATTWKQIYPVREKHIRFYAAKAIDGGNYSRLNNQIYDFTDYYAVIRIPYNLFKVKNILYEGSYISCPLDYDWYYKKGNWKKLSEVKIKAYVESLGEKYEVAS